MKTLQSWHEKLAHTPFTIQCFSMRILGKDAEADVFVGPGEIQVDNPQSISFSMYASLPDLTHTKLCLTRAQANPYDTLSQFRLLATDFEGNEWNGGWMSPSIQDESSSVSRLTGSLRHLSTRVQDSSVSTLSSVELLFTPAPDLPLSEFMLTVSSIGGSERMRSSRPARHHLHLLDSQIEFEIVGDSSLAVTATNSNDLPHPHLENWLAEPLRILFGQLIYARLTARNLGNGTAYISLRAVPEPRPTAQWIGLWQSGLGRQDVDFWNLYSRLLTLIVKARGSDGHSNFESNRITRFYEEASQASFG